MHEVIKEHINYILVNVLKFLDSRSPSSKLSTNHNRYSHKFMPINDRISASGVALSKENLI